MPADVNVTEKVARAIEDALMQPTHAPMATHDPRPAATFFLLTAVVNHHIAREAIREHEARRRP